MLTELVGVARDEAVDRRARVRRRLRPFRAVGGGRAHRLPHPARAARRRAAPSSSIPGNHDNAKRFAAIEQLFERRRHRRRARASGGRRRAASSSSAPATGRADRADRCAPVGAENGAVRRRGDDGPRGGRRYQAYAEELPRLLTALCSTVRRRRRSTVLAAHLFVGGARVGGGERELTVGDLFAIAPQALPTTPQYIALGHVHRPQPVPAASVPARYAGSLLQLDFGEREQDKSVVVIDVEPGLPARTRARPADRRPAAARRDRGRSTTCGAWTSTPRPGCRVDPRAATARRRDSPTTSGPCSRMRSRCASTTSAPPASASPASSAALAARAVHAVLRASATAHAADERLMKLFDELLEEVTGAPA